LEKRGKQYGNFIGHSILTQNLKRMMHQHNANRAWKNCTDDQREALDMIVHKIGRILNGNPDYPDSWFDIAGYAMLVYRTLKQQEKGESQKKGD
jgi:hypothetical protein